MVIRKLLAIVARVALSIPFAGVFYTGWMAVTIPTIQSGFGGWVVKVVLWILAPTVTGFGFALSSKIFDLLSRATDRRSFWSTYKWCLAGCAIGGGILNIFGPMLIVFGMFVAGTLSIAVHEVITTNKGGDLAKEAG